MMFHPPARIITPSAPRRWKSGHPRYVQTLFVLFGAYLAVPVIDVPLFGLSLSAVLMLLIADRLVITRGWSIGPEYRPFRGAFGAVVGGTILSTLLGALIAGTGETYDYIINIVRFSYWGIAGFLCMQLVREVDLDVRLMYWIQRGVHLLIILLGVAVFAGREVMTPNSFAFQITLFSPFLLPGLGQPGLKKLPTVLWLMALWGLAVMNGSRQGILLLAIQLIGFLFLVSVFSKDRVRNLILLPLTVGAIAIGLWAALMFAPPRVSELVNRKLVSTENLDTDKSWQIRKVKIDHALKVFWDYPIAGVGAGALRHTEVDLVLPRALRYTNQEDMFARSAHNSHIQLLAEGGLIGFVPWVIWIFLLAWKGFQMIPGELRNRRYLLVCTYLAFIGMIIEFWVISAHTGTAPFFIFGCLAGSILKAQTRQRFESLRYVSREFRHC